MSYITAGVGARELRRSAGPRCSRRRMSGGLVRVARYLANRVRVITVRPLRNPLHGVRQFAFAVREARRIRRMTIRPAHPT